MDELLLLEKWYHHSLWPYRKRPGSSEKGLCRAPECAKQVGMRTFCFQNPCDRRHTPNLGQLRKKIPARIEKHICYASGDHEDARCGAWSYWQPISWPLYRSAHQCIKQSYRYRWLLTFHQIQRKDVASMYVRMCVCLGGRGACAC